MIKLPPGISIEETSLDRRYAGVLKGLLTRIKKLYDEIYERFGDDGLQLISDVSSGYGTEIALKARKNGAPWDIERVGLYLIKVFNNMRAEGEVSEFGIHRIGIKVPVCPYPFTNPAICAAHTSMEESLVKGLNPNLKYTIEKCLPRGDHYCLHVLHSTD